MSSLDLDQVLYARAGWRKAILVPLWTFQVAVLLCLMGIFAYRLAETFEHYDEHDRLGEVPLVEVVWEATNVAFNLVALVLNILEIARKATERLTPFMMVCTHVVKLALALAVLALDIVAYLRRIDAHYSTIGLSLDCGLLAATLVTFAYSLATYRRLLKYEDYQLTAGAARSHAIELGATPPKSGVIATTTTELVYSDGELTAADRSLADVHTQLSPYVRPYQGGSTPTDTTTTASIPRNSPSPLSSSHSPPHSPTPHSPPPNPAPAQTQGNPAITNQKGHHYLQQNRAQTKTTSPQDLQTQINRALDAEFGWADDHGPGASGIDRSRSVVLGSGMVAGRAGLVAPGGGLCEGGRGVEVGVIEEVEGGMERERRVKGGRREGRGEDEEALLSGR